MQRLTLWIIFSLLLTAPESRADPGSWRDAVISAPAASADKVDPGSAHFSYRILDGDGSIEMPRPPGERGGGRIREAGLMIRESTAASAPYAALTFGRSAAPRFDVRRHAGEGEQRVIRRGTAPASWLRLVRAGDEVLAYGSEDRRLWVEIGRVEVEMARSVLVGLIGPGGGGEISGAKVGAVVEQGIRHPLPRFDAHAASGEAPFTVSFENSSQGARSYRWDFGDGTSSTDPAPAHTYLEVGRYVPRLTAFAAGDIVTSMGTGPLTVFDPTANLVLEPWSNEDIGAVAITGAAEATGGEIVVDASGERIGGVADAFHFVHQVLAGNGAVEATVGAPDPFRPRGAAGLMIRESPDDDAAHAMMRLDATERVSFYARPSAGANTEKVLGPVVGSPVSLRLERAGDELIGSYAAAGGSWIELGRFTVPMGSCHIGPALTSGSNEVLARATFSEISVIGGSVTADFSAVPTAGTAPLEVSFTDLSSGEVVDRLWDFGDGQTSSEANPIHTYLETGLYDVSLTVSGGGGDSDTLFRGAYVSVTGESAGPVRLAIEPFSALLTEAGQSVLLELRAFDENGQAMPPGEVTWSVDDAAAAELTASGESAVVTAHQVLEPGAVLITATAGDLVTTMPVYLAELAPEARALDPALIESIAYEAGDEEREHPVVIVTRTAGTESIVPGNVIVPAASTQRIPGLVARVNAVSLGTDTVELQTDEATLPEAFAQLRGSFRLGPTPIADLSGASISAAPANRPEKTDFDSFADVECETPDGYLVEISFSGWSIGLARPPLTFDVDFDIETGFTVEAGVDLEAEIVTGEIQVELGAALELECRVSFPNVRLALPLGTSGIFVDAVPEIGIKAKFLAQDSVVSFVGPTLDLRFMARGGLYYDAAEQTFSFSHQVTEDSVTLDVLPDFSFEQAEQDALSVTAFAFGGASIGVVDPFSVVLPIEILRLKLLNARAGPVAEIELPLSAITEPPAPPQSEYLSPSLVLSGLVKIEAQPEVESIGGFTFDLLEMLFGSLTGFNIDEPSLFELTVPLGGTPGVSLSASNPLPAVDEEVQLVFEAEPFLVGSRIERLLLEDRPVGIWASMDGGTPSLLGEGLVDFEGRFSLDWQVPALGHYEVAALAYDRFFGVLLMPLLTPSLELYVLPPGEAIRILDFDADPDTGAAPLETTFTWQTEHLGGGTATCTLNPGDGSDPYVIESCIGSFSQEHTYAEESIYQAVLVVEDGENGAGALLDIEVRPPYFWPFAGLDAARTSYNSIETGLESPLGLERFIPLPGGQTSTHDLVVGHDSFAVAHQGTGASRIETRATQCADLLWSAEVPGRGPELGLHDDILLAVSWSSSPRHTHLNAFDAGDGSPLWSLDLPEVHPGDWLLHRGHLFMLEGSAPDGEPITGYSLVARDLETGDQVFRTDPVGLLRWPIALSGDAVVLVSPEPAILGFDRTSGAQLWRHELAGTVLGEAMTAEGSTVFVRTTADVENDAVMISWWRREIPVIGGALGLRASTGDGLWSTDEEVLCDSGSVPIIKDGRIYYPPSNYSLGTLDGQPLPGGPALDCPQGTATEATVAANGTVYWSQGFHDQIEMQGLPVDGGEPTVFWRPSWDGEWYPWLAPAGRPKAVADGKLFVIRDIAGGAAGVEIHENVYSLSGTVRYQDGSPLEGIAVRLETRCGQSLVLTTDEAGRYELDPAFAGDYTLTPELENPRWQAVPEHIEVTLPPSAEGLDFEVVFLNEAPVAGDDSFTTGTGIPTHVDIRLNDSDPEGDALSWGVLSQPVHGSLEAEDDGGYLYVPAEGFTGSDGFTYRLSDEYGAEDTATVSFEVIPWQGQDIGFVGVAGSFARAGANFVIEGSGDPVGLDDPGYLVYLPFCGAGSLTARWDSLTGTSFETRAGILITESPSSSSPNVLITRSHLGFVETTYRRVPGGPATNVGGDLTGDPVWLRIARQGDTVTSHRSSDGIMWIQTATVNLELDGAFVGLYVTSDDNAELATGELGGVELDLACN